MAYGLTPLVENNNTGLGIAYVEIVKDASGQLQTANRRYWNHTTKVFEPGPRDDAKHVAPYQRLTDDVMDVDNFIQVKTVDGGALDQVAVIQVVYNLDASNKVTSIFQTYSRAYALANGAVNNANY
jgi:hypothetical protein